MLILLLNAIGITNGNAYDFSAVCSSGQTLYYNITDATNHLVKVVFPGSSSLDPWKGYTKPTGDLLIPESVTYNNESYSVTSISYNSFYGCTGIISVTIGESVTSIDGGAFSSCNGLVQVNWNARNAINNSQGSLFSTSNLTTIIFGDSVQTIPANVLRSCSHLTSVTFGGSVASIGSDVFFK